MSAPAANLAVPETSNRSTSDRARLLAIAIFAILSCYCAFTSQGFVAADACMHYLYARFAIREPAYLVDVWGRPLVTALYALPAAWGGRLAVRCVCLVIAILCADVAYQIARGQKLRWAVLALLFTLGQPLLFLYSFGEMTELPFALLVGLAFLAYQRKSFWLMACLVALSPLARPEGFGFLLLAGLALLYQRQSQWILILPMPLFAWDIAGWIVITNHQGHWYRWLIDAWPYASTSLYGHGNVLSFVAQLPVIVSPLVLPATLLGIGRPFRRHRAESGDNAHLLHCRRWLALIPLLVLVAHSLLYWTGRLASFGEIRYLLVVAPLWGVLSAQGWEWIFTRFQWHHPLAWAGAAILAPIVVNFYHPVVPIRLSADWKIAQSLASGLDGPRVQSHPILMAAHPGLFYFLDISPRDPARTRFWKPDEVAARKPGTILIWDPIYGDQNASQSAAITLDSIRRAGWREIRRINASDDELLARPDLAKLPLVDARRAWHVFSSDPPPPRRPRRRGRARSR